MHTNHDTTIQKLNFCANTDFLIFTKKVGVLPRLPECPASLHSPPHFTHPNLLHQVMIQLRFQENREKTDLFESQ